MPHERSCADCRTTMDQFVKMDHTMLSQISAQFLSVLVRDDYTLDSGVGWGGGVGWSGVLRGGGGGGMGGGARYAR